MTQEEYQKMLAEARITPVPVGEGVGYKEASLTFLCRKIYQHQLNKQNITPEVQQFYADNPKAYPVDENGDWKSHWLFMGEIIDVIEK